MVQEEISVCFLPPFLYRAPEMLFIPWVRVVGLPVLIHKTLWNLPQVYVNEMIGGLKLLENFQKRCDYQKSHLCDSRVRALRLTT